MNANVPIMRVRMWHCSYAKFEIVKIYALIIQPISQNQYLRQFVHVLPFSAIKLVYLVATSFCLIVCKIWKRENLCTNNSIKISKSIFKEICICSTILSYKTVMISHNIILHVCMQNVNSRKFVLKWFKQDLKFNI